MAGGALVLSVLLAAGCQKPVPPAPEAPTNAAPVVTNTPPPTSRGKDLGIVQLTNRCETQVQVGDGKSCTIKPVLLDPQRLQLTMTLESKLTDGTTRGLKVMTVVAKPDQPLEVDFGSLVFTLTPQLVTPPPPQ